MKTILTKCNLCGEDHAICRMIGTKETRIGVICNGKFYEHEFKELESIGELEGIPEYYTPSAKKALALKGNLQFIMPLVKDGEKVGREWYHKTDAELLEQEIGDLLALVKELESQIVELESKRKEYKEKAQKLGAKLSELKTEELFK